MGDDKKKGWRGVGGKGFSVAKRLPGAWYLRGISYS